MDLIEIILLLSVVTCLAVLDAAAVFRTLLVVLGVVAFLAGWVNQCDQEKLFVLGGGVAILVLGFGDLREMPEPPQSPSGFYE